MVVRTTSSTISTYYRCTSRRLDEAARVPLIGLHRLVFIATVTRSAYLLSLRLSGVLVVDTSIGQRCFTIHREELSRSRL